MFDFDKLQRENDALRGKIIRVNTKIETDIQAKYLTEEEKQQLKVGAGDSKWFGFCAYPRGRR